jgi:dihydrofolate synthase / folylpolyglutamate synthase
MKVTSYRTPLFLPPKDNISRIPESLPQLKERSIVAISSKIVSICEGRCVPVSQVSKDILVEAESDRIFRPLEENLGNMVLTLKDGQLIESAGIDQSNADHFYILMPKNPIASAKHLWQLIRKAHNLEEVGIVITDSHSIPSRQGAVGMALGSFGFIPVHHNEGKGDVFGNKLSLSTSNLAEGFAASAVLEMGEGPEQTPLVVLEDVKGVRFYKKSRSILRVKKYEYVNPKQDVYAPLIH